MTMSRKEAARKAGKSYHSSRGLQSADRRTRQRVARAGGRASHGGGREAGLWTKVKRKVGAD